MRDEENRSIYQGNVRLVQGSLEITSDRLRLISRHLNLLSRQMLTDGPEAIPPEIFERVERVPDLMAG